jgi:hypothetical protein
VGFQLISNQFSLIAKKVTMRRLGQFVFELIYTVKPELSGGAAPLSRRISAA